MFVSKKKYQELLNSISELSELIKGKEYQQLKKDSEELKKTKELLSHVKFKLKEARVMDNGMVRIKYELPTVIIGVDENGELEKDNFFYSTNYLEMISYEDMHKIQEKLNEVIKSS